MTTTYADIEQDLVESHLTSVALDERIAQRQAKARWYRDHRALLARGSKADEWHQDRLLNLLVLHELLILRRTVQRAAAR